MDGRRATRCLVSTSTPGPTRFAAPSGRRPSSTTPTAVATASSSSSMVLAFETLQHVDVTSCGAHREEVRLPVRPALPGSRPRIDVYDSPRRIPPQRCFDDVLRAAMGRPTL